MKRICFVVMPFGKGDEYKGKEEESRFVYNDIIKPSVNVAVSEFKKEFGDRLEHDIEIIRELEDVSPGAITSSIIKHIAQAHIAIIDMTGRNPNVFLELGIRYALRRNGTILLAQDISEVPFNVKHFRVVEYCPHFDGIEKAKKQLEATVLKALQSLDRSARSHTDSLVFDALRDLRVSASGLREEPIASINVTWDEYWARTSQIVEILSELNSNGVYKPNVIVGISNGGLFLADTTLRLVFGNSVPLVSLWAQRSKERYFDNPINNILISEEVLTKISYEQERIKPIKILVMDDIVGTTRTFNQVVEYFQRQLKDFYKNIELRFVFLYTPREDTVTGLQEYLLSHDRRIARRYKPIEQALEAVTGKSVLPYRKSIPSGDVIPSNTEFTTNIIKKRKRTTKKQN